MTSTFASFWIEIICHLIQPITSTHYINKMKQLADEKFAFHKSLRASTKDPNLAFCWKTEGFEKHWICIDNSTFLIMYLPVLIHDMLKMIFRCLNIWKFVIKAPDLTMSGGRICPHLKIWHGTYSLIGFGTFSPFVCKSRGESTKLGGAPF